jgi:hypothetical protein
VGLFATDRSLGLVTFDPSSSEQRTHLTLPTGSTTVSVLSPAVADGVLYAAGGFAPGDSGGALGGEVPQVFAIRADEAVQGLRDFVAESALLQDFDPHLARDAPTAYCDNPHLAGQPAASRRLNARGE